MLFHPFREPATGMTRLSVVDSPPQAGTEEPGVGGGRKGQLLVRDCHTLEKVVKYTRIVCQNVNDVLMNWFVFFS